MVISIKESGNRPARCRLKLEVYGNQIAYKNNFKDKQKRKYLSRKVNILPPYIIFNQTSKAAHTIFAYNHKKWGSDIDRRRG